MENVLTAAPQTVQQKARRRLKHTDPSKNLISSIPGSPAVSYSSLVAPYATIEILVPSPLLF